MASPAMRFTKFVIGLRGKKEMRSAAAFCRHYQGRTYPRPWPVTLALKAACRMEKTRIHGHPVYTFFPRHQAPRAHILYTHGSAYVNALIRPHWSIVKQLVQAGRAAVTVPLYPLAPEHTFEDAYALLETVYQNLIAATPSAQVVLAGDSAGGGLALGQAVSYRDRGLPLPGRIILFAPWLDITLSNPDIPALERKDPMLARPGLIQAGRWWAETQDPAAPLLSPLFANLSGLPPIDLFQGTHDILLADARKLKNAVTAANGEIHFYEYPGAFHVFVGATFTPETRDVFGKIADVLCGL